MGNYEVQFTAPGGDTFDPVVGNSGTASVNSIANIHGITPAVTLVPGQTVINQNEGFYCFYPGTRIATPTGEQAVETLRIGDLVLTSDGAARPVRWMGRQSVSTRFQDPLRVLPVRIRAGAFAPGLPHRDLLVSPDHALLLGSILVQAGALVNGLSILREAIVPERFTYHHIELADHSLILAEGAAAETFIDNVNRLRFDNWEEHRTLYPDATEMLELPYPRAQSARQVPSALRCILAARAVEIRSAAALAA